MSHRRSADARSRAARQRGSADTYNTHLIIHLRRVGRQFGVELDAELLLPFEPVLQVTNATGRASMSEARAGAAYVSDPVTGQLYAIGGKNRNNTLWPRSRDTLPVKTWSSVADSWKTIAPMPQARYGPARLPMASATFSSSAETTVRGLRSTPSFATRSRPTLGQRGALARAPAIWPAALWHGHLLRRRGHELAGPPPRRVDRII